MQTPAATGVAGDLEQRKLIETELAEGEAAIDQALKKYETDFSLNGEDSPQALTAERQLFNAAVAARQKYLSLWREAEALEAEGKSVEAAEVFNTRNRQGLRRAQHQRSGACKAEPAKRRSCLFRDRGRRAEL